MAERRSLLEGLDTIEPGDRTVEDQFVYGKKARWQTPAGPPTAKFTPLTAAKPQATLVVESPAPETEISF